VRVYLNGTDANQFQPLIDTDTYMSAFVNNLERTARFTYLNESEDMFPPLTVFNY
jgi:hypothetical protein